MHNYRSNSRQGIHILVIHPKFSVFGGAEIAAVEMMSYWRKSGHQVTVVSARFSKHFLRIFQSKGIKTKSVYLPFVPPDDLERRNLMLVGWLLRIRKIFRDVDIVNIHNSPSNFWLLYASRFGKDPLPPVIWTCHEPPRIRYRDLLNDDSPLWQFTGELQRPINISSSLSNDGLRTLDLQSMELITEIQANSAHTSHNIDKVYGKKAMVNHIGIPVCRGEDELQMQAFHAKKRSREKRIFTMVTRLEPAKNVHVVLEALSYLQKEDPDIQDKLDMFIIGTGPIYEKLCVYSHRIGVPWVQFLGWVEEEKKQEYLGASDCILYLPICEPLGLVPLEAGRWGTPTIGSREGGVLETVLDYTTGILVDPKNSLEVANAIKWALSHHEQLLSMGSAAFDHVQNSFSIDQTAERFLESVSRLQPVGFNDQ